MEIGQVVVEQFPQGARNPGVVHHDVQTAERLDGTGDQRSHLLGIGDVGLPEDGPGAQRCRQRRTPLVLDIGDDDTRALRDKPFHEAASDAGRAAGDDGDLAIKFVDHLTS